MSTCWFSFKCVSVNQRIVHKVLLYKTWMLCDLALLFQTKISEQIINFLVGFTHMQYGLPQLIIYYSLLYFKSQGKNDFEVASVL